jgi:hypothetical protein
MQFKYLGAGALAGAVAAAAMLPTAASAQHATALSFNAADHVSIHAQPNPIVAGDSVVIFGRLFARDDQNRLVVLYVRAGDSSGAFIPVQVTHTGVDGAYEFSRADGNVDTNRAWYVAAASADSRIVNERVAALVTIAATGPGGVQEPNGSVLQTGKGHQYTFAGTTAPAIAGTEVLLQRQSASAGLDNWATIGRGQVQSDGTFSIVHTFAVPSASGGDANVRVLVRKDASNIASPSTSLSYEIEQSQNPQLTIVPTAYSILEGASDTISGVDAAGSGVLLTLDAHVAGKSFAPIATTTTGTDGAYTFQVSPVYNTYYRVRSSVVGSGATGASGPSGASGASSTARSHTVSATAFVGVRAVLTEQATATTINQGQSVTFSGMITPDKTGHNIYLERENAAGTGWHIIASAVVGANSMYSLTRAFYVAGTETVRIAINGSPENQGAATAPITITVDPIPANQLVPTQG